jgi:hypothetical protein
MVVCLEILVCAAGSSKVDAFTAQVSERVRMKSKRREKIFLLFVYFRPEVMIFKLVRAVVVADPTLRKQQ